MLTVSNLTGLVTVVVLARPSAACDEDRTCWSAASARMMPAIACAMVGLFAIARSIACANVRRSRPWATTVEGTSTSKRTPVAQTFMICATRSLGMRVALRDDELSCSPQRLDDDIQNRNKQNVQERREQHAARDGGADRVPALLPCARCEDERHHAEDERQGRHQNRPQSDARGFNRGIDNRQSFGPELLRELDDQDGVF